MLLDLISYMTGVFVVVYDGQHGLRFTLGRAREIVPPGVHFKVPIFQSIKVEETKHTTLDLEPQVIQLSDELVYEVECKVVYYIYDLRKAMIEVDELKTGMQNRVVLAVQQVVQAQDRESVKDTEAMASAIRDKLASMEEQWGVRILQFGFSNISPSPVTLEITQLDLLAREKLALYDRFRRCGLSDEATVALISGAVVALGQEATPSSSRIDEERLADELMQIARPPKPKPIDEELDEDEEAEDGPPGSERSE